MTTHGLIQSYQITTGTMIRAIFAIWRVVCAEFIVMTTLLFMRGQLDQITTAMAVIVCYAVATYPMGGTR